jgi:hypothetical protein
MTQLPVTMKGTIHNNEGWFVIAALTDSVDPQGYIKDMLRRDPELSKEVGANCHPPFRPDLRQAKRL